MANTFKRAVLPNIGTALGTVYTVPAVTTTVVIGLTLSNISGGSITATVQLVTAGGTSHIAKDIPIPGGSSIELMAGNKYVMEATDAIKVSGSVVGAIDATMSLMEIS